VFDKSDPSAAGNQQLVDLYRKTFPVASENDDFVVFRNKNAHSFVSATAKACLYVGDVKQSPQLALALAAKDFTLVHAEGGQPRGEFVQTYNAGSQPFLPATPSAPVALEKVQVVRDNADQMRITLTAPGNCVAVIAESYFPFWRAELDGRTVPVLRTDCALMGVEVPAGAHTIRLWYEPPRTYLASQCVSVLAVVALSGALVVARARKKNG
jgi:hypothetical protein